MQQNDMWPKKQTRRLCSTTSIGFSWRNVSLKNSQGELKTGTNKISERVLMKLLKFIQTRSSYWGEWILTLKMKTMCLHPSCELNLASEYWGKQVTRIFLGVQEEVIRDSSKRVSEVSLLISLPSQWWEHYSHHPKESGFQETPWVLSYTSKFHPRFVI
jgi:hypothetical protein